MHGIVAVGSRGTLELEAESEGVCEIATIDFVKCCDSNSKLYIVLTR